MISSNSPTLALSLSLFLPHLLAYLAGQVNGWKEKSFACFFRRLYHMSYVVIAIFVAAAPLSERPPEVLLD